MFRDAAVAHMFNTHKVIWSGDRAVYISHTSAVKNLQHQSHQHLPIEDNTHQTGPEQHRIQVAPRRTLAIPRPIQPEPASHHSLKPRTQILTQTDYTFIRMCRTRVHCRKCDRHITTRQRSCRYISRDSNSQRHNASCTATTPGRELVGPCRQCNRRSREDRGKEHEKTGPIPQAKK
jgi:hypothetical protein